MEVEFEVKHNPFEDLPEDIISHIISFASIDTLSVLLGVSKRFLVLSSSSFLPVLDHYSSRDISTKDIFIILSNSEYFYEISLLNYQISKEILKLIEKKNSKEYPLQKLHFKSHSLNTKDVIESLGKLTLPKLKDFGLKQDSSSDFKILDVLNLTKKLDKLYLEGFDFSEVKNEFYTIMNSYIGDLTEISLIDVIIPKFENLELKNLLKCKLKSKSHHIELSCFKSKNLRSLEIDGDLEFNFKDSLVFENLEKFHLLHNSKVRNTSCVIDVKSFINSFPKLKDLKLSCIVMKDNGVCQILDKLDLTEFSLIECDAPLQLSSINHSLSLIKLEIHRDIIGFDELYNLIDLSPNLQILSCQHITFKNEIYNFIDKKKNKLKKIEFSDSSGGKLFTLMQIVSQSKGLTFLNLKNYQFETRNQYYGEFSQYLDKLWTKFPDLSYLNLEKTDLAEDIIKYFANCKVQSLRSLNLSDLKIGTDWVVKLFENNQRISEFYCENSSIDNKCIMNLYSKDLTLLNLSYSCVTEKGLQYLTKGMAGTIENLRLFGIEIEDKSKFYEFISKCSNLRFIAINAKSFGLEDELFGSLDNCYFLEDLSICGHGKTSKARVEKFVLDHQFLKFMVLDDSPLDGQEVNQLLIKCRKKGRRAPKLVFCHSGNDSNLKKNLTRDPHNSSYCEIL
jgi:hypothetical protein